MSTARVLAPHCHELVHCVQRITSTNGAQNGGKHSHFFLSRDGALNQSVRELGKTTPVDAAQSKGVYGGDMPRRHASDETRKLLATAAGIGAVAGLRSMTAPAVVSWAAKQKWSASSSRGLSLLGSKKTATVLSALAIGELVVDKLPSTPSRTEPLGLSARALTGALSAGAICASKRKLVPAGAVVGALAAVAGAFVGYRTRRQLRSTLNVSDAAIAIAEDAVAIGGGVLLLRNA